MGTVLVDEQAVESFFHFVTAFDLQVNENNSVFVVEVSWSSSSCFLCDQIFQVMRNFDPRPILVISGQLTFLLVVKYTHNMSLILQIVGIRQCILSSSLN